MKETHADALKLEGGEEELAKSLPEISFQLKWLVARDLWDTCEAVRLYNKNNEFFKKGYAIIKKRKMDKVLKKEEK